MIYYIKDNGFSFKLIKNDKDNLEKLMLIKYR